VCARVHARARATAGFVAKSPPHTLAHQHKHAYQKHARTLIVVRPVMKPNAYSPTRGCRMITHSWKAFVASFSGFNAALTCAAHMCACVCVCVCVCACVCACVCVRVCICLPAASGGQGGQHMSLDGTCHEQLPAPCSWCALHEAPPLASFSLLKSCPSTCPGNCLVSACQLTSPVCRHGRAEHGLKQCSQALPTCLEAPGQSRSHSQSRSQACPFLL